MKPTVYDRTPIPVRIALTMLVCALGLGVAGCRLVDMSELMSRFREEQKPTATSRLTDALAEALNADAWTANYQWSPVTEPSSPLRSVRKADIKPRWLFRPVLTDGGPAFDVEDFVARHRTENSSSGSTETTSAANIAAEAIEQLTMLARRDDIVGWNATILLAHRDPVAAQPFVTTLAQLVGDPPVSTQQEKNAPPDKKPIVRTASDDLRAAAAEAWCLVLATAETDGEVAMAIPGHLLTDMQRSRDNREILKHDLPTSVETELIRGVGRRVAPARIRDVPALLNRSLRSSASQGGADARRGELHRAAMDACVLHALYLRGSSRDEAINLHDTEVWPSSLWNCGEDTDPWVRGGYGLLLAIAKDPGALKVLSQQIADTQSDVQRRALQNLGLVGTEEARQQLHEYMTRESLLRKVAVQGLAAFGEKELIRYVDDEDARVREELALQLTRFHNRASATALAKLLTDDVFSVQVAVIDNLGEWPDELLLPLLLHGAVEGNYQTRDKSLAMYARRTNIVVPPFRPNDDYDLRRERAAATASRGRIHYPMVGTPLAAGENGSGRIDTERVAEITHRLQLAVGLGAGGDAGFAGEWFRQLDATDLPAVEKVWRQSEPAAQAYLFREVLPHLAEEYAALVDMDDNDVRRRRAAAGTLRRIGQSRSLPDILLNRLADILVREEDAVVWQEILTAVEQDATEPVARIVQLAVNHRWPDVRRRGCEYVHRHGRPDFAPWVQQLFQDPNPAVQLEAIRAAGRCGHRQVLEDVLDEKGSVMLVGLSGLLTSFSGEKHLAVVESMSRLLDPRGLDELHRLSYSGDWRTRVAAVELMATTGQTRFVDRLIDILWLEQETRPEVQRAALGALKTLIPAAEHPAELNTLQTPAQQAAVWHSWWEQRSQKAQVILPTAAENGYNRPQ